MAAQRGKDLLIRIANGGAFLAVAGLRARQIAFNAEAVDVTNADSAGRWRELLAGAGVRRAAVSGAGVFRDEASDARLRQVFFDGTLETYQIVVPGFGTLEGAFQIASLEYRGDHAGEVTFDMALDSAGPLAFTAA
ncbi:MULTISPECIES: phage major tail protein, TP901-1 family [unclassified Methylobacterium]|uniref:phage major tail protein, TP901-1 family n=1 Tax=unclassified Methylobacterium TaxID=2615210 RepID=UPI0006FCF3FE|nr:MULTISPECIES: phage major tail protein, TP901-1 family [unclassified Methylobacterium]KQP88076.1 phage tail protein [Methylobacterium sp. Leaf117]KQP94699.1 phage tail protein [Methylobacterium sp. Leaf113]MCK2055529.1 phage major tail protein, TP901-1 family [Methylobacterium sp. 37f]